MENSLFNHLGERQRVLEDELNSMYVEGEDDLPTRLGFLEYFFIISHAGSYRVREQMSVSQSGRLHVPPVSGYWKGTAGVVACGGD